MKIDLVICLFVALLTLQINAEGAGAADPRRNLRRAVNEGAQAQYTFKVEDSTGKPVSNATVSVGFVMLNRKSNRVVGKTNSEGIFVAKDIAQWEVGARVSKKGYYESKWALFLAKDEKSVSDGRWLPWNLTIPLVLREERKPIPLYVAWVDFDKGFPSDTDVGFDCERHDYVAPHGDGKNSDFLVRISSLDISGHDKACRLTLSAIDNGGGFVVKKKELSSKLVSDYEAPADGYSPEFRTSKTTKLKFYEKNPDDVSEDEYLILKSRIVRDQNGEIISANYGKIYGPVEYVFSLERGRGAIKFLYYFNPTPNDRNLEFDGKNNLFKPGWKSTLRWSQDP